LFVDIVERGEEGDVVVGKAQPLRVLRGEAHCAAEDRVVRPDAVLQEQREETDREGISKLDSLPEKPE